MGADTAISWADHTVNFWAGCTKVSPACDHCYAEHLMDTRLHVTKWGPHGERKWIAQGWKDAMRFQRFAEAFMRTHGRRQRVFVNSLSDFFDNHRSIVWRDEAWLLMRACPDVIFMLLTKRPQNIEKMLPDDWGDGYPNVWLGTTVENQEEADRRLGCLLPVKAALHFASYEPALGPVDWCKIRPDGIMFTLNALNGRGEHILGYTGQTNALKLIIGGGESGKDARAPHPRWFVDTLDACEEHGTIFHFKQWGEWQPFISVGDVGTFIAHGKEFSGEDLHRFDDGSYSARVGIKNAGHLLEGVEHRRMPEDIR